MANKVILRNYEGVICSYAQPTDYQNPCTTCQKCKLGDKHGIGLQQIFDDEVVSLEPAGLERHRRN